MKAPLDKLNDFYQPPPPAWTPQTPAWYALFTIVGLLLLWLILHLIRRWFANRYREALRELHLLTAPHLSALLKRTALAAWPREKVASLNGDSWLAFLDDSAGTDLFHRTPGNRIEELALHPISVSSEEEQALRDAAATWIRRHRVQA